MKPSFWAGLKNPLIPAALLAGLALTNLWWYNAVQDRSVQELRRETDTLQEQVNELEARVEKLSRRELKLHHRNKAIIQENRLIRQEMDMLEAENLLLRSATILYHGHRDSNKVSITIDDGGDRASVERTLDHLRDLGVKVTFFPLGAWVTVEPEAWRRAVAEGHELGNHTYSHPFLTRVSEEQIRRELAMWREVVEEILGRPYAPRYFRPPGMDGFTYGDPNRDYYQRIVAGEGMITVLWDVEVTYALRHEQPAPARVAEYVIGKAKPGSIILLHFGWRDIEALPAMVRGLRAKGLEPVTLTELLAGAANRQPGAGE